jgi:hypothetical protein
MTVFSKRGLSHGNCRGHMSGLSTVYRMEEGKTKTSGLDPPIRLLMPRSVAAPIPVQTRVTVSRILPHISGCMLFLLIKGSCSYKAPA